MFSTASIQESNRSRQEKLEEALKAAEVLLDVFRDAMGSLPWSMTDFEPEYEAMLDRLIRARAALKEE